MATKRRFRGLRDAEVSQASLKFCDGNFDVAVLAVKDTGGDDNDERFCLETYILACDDCRFDSTGIASRVLVAGDKPSVTYKYGERTTMGHVKAICLGLGYEEEDIGNDLGESLVSDENPARGLIMHLNAITKPQQADKMKGYTHLNWTPASPETYERYESQLRELFPEAFEE